MKRLHKCMNWLLLIILIMTNSPLIYANEINQIIEQSQTEQAYQKAVEEANKQIVGSENANAENNSSTEVSQSPSKEEGDAIQQPKVVSEESDAEAELKQKYGEPVAVSGQEQLFRVDETNFVTHIGSDIKT